MSSLDYCLKKNKDLTEYEKKQLKAAAASYRSEGYKAEISNVSAVEDAIRDMESEKSDVIEQIKDKAPKGMDVGRLMEYEPEPEAEVPAEEAAAEQPAPPAGPPKPEPPPAIKTSMDKATSGTGAGLIYDGIQEGFGSVKDSHQMTILSGPAKGMTFTVENPTKENIIKKILAKERLKTMLPDIPESKPAGTVRATKDGISMKTESGGVILYGGIPGWSQYVHSKQALEALYDEYLGAPLWKFLSETTPKYLGDRSQVIDAILKGVITDYKKDPAIVDLIDETKLKIFQFREMMKQLALSMARFSKSEQVREAQIHMGSITSAPKRYHAVLKSIEIHEALHSKLKDLGLLGPDNRFTQLTRKQLAAKRKEMKALDDEIAKKTEYLKPIIKIGKVARRIAEDVSETIVQTKQETATGAFETKVTKWTELNEKRVLEALTARGFAEGEATQMINRIKESVVPLEGKTGTYKEITTTVEKVVTKTIIQEVQSLRTFHPQFMKRAKGEILKDINALHKKRMEIADRIKLHYKMSGKLYLRQAYEKYENEKSFLAKVYGIIRKPRTIRGYEIQRKDLTPLYKEYLGIIKRVPYLAYKGAVEEAHDAFMTDMFNQVAMNKKRFVSFDEWETAKSLGEGENASQKRVERWNEIKNFKRLPITPKLGNLSGGMIDPYIYDDFNEAVVMRTKIGKVFDTLLALWKTGKVVWYPAAQSRNFFSNMLLADAGGVPPIEGLPIYVKTIKDFAQKKGSYLEARQTPLMSDIGFAATETHQFYNDLSELDLTSTDSLLASVLKASKKLLDFPSKLYQANERFFKLLVFNGARAKGMSIKEAYKHAENWMFNYGKIPPAIRWAKRYYSPFITFSYKAVPRLMGETVVRKPWKFIKWAIALGIIEEYGRRIMGESKEEVKRQQAVLPDFMRKKLLPGQLGHLRLPYKDDRGRSKYLDITFILPWGDVAEQWGQSRLNGRPFLPSHPLWITVAEVAFNRVMFTDQELSRRISDNWWDYTKKIGTEIFRQAAPAMAGSYGYNKLVTAITGDLDWAGRDRTIPEAVLDTILGLKIRSIDYREEVRRRFNDVSKEYDSLRSEYIRKYTNVMRDPTPDVLNDRQRYKELLEEYVKKLDRLTAEERRIRNRKK